MVNVTRGKDLVCHWQIALVPNFFEQSIGYFNRRDLAFHGGIPFQRRGLLCLLVDVSFFSTYIN
jgi:hypothetical protein